MQIKIQNTKHYPKLTYSAFRITLVFYTYILYMSRVGAKTATKYLTFEGQGAIIYAIYINQ